MVVGPIWTWRGVSGETQVEDYGFSYTIHKPCIIDELFHYDAVIHCMRIVYNFRNSPWILWSRPFL